MRTTLVALLAALAAASPAAAAPGNDDVEDARPLADLPARVCDPSAATR